MKVCTQRCISLTTNQDRFKTRFDSVLAASCCAKIFASVDPLSQNDSETENSPTSWYICSWYRVRRRTCDFKTSIFWSAALCFKVRRTIKHVKLRRHILCKWCALWCNNDLQKGASLSSLAKLQWQDQHNYDPTQCLCCAFLLLHRSSTEARALRYTSVPRTTHLLWQRKGLPAFYRGLNDLQFWSMPGSTFAVLVQEYCRRWCELFLKPWPSSPSMSMHWLLWIFLEPSHRQLEHMSLDFIVLCIAHVLGLAEWSRAEQSCAQILRQLLGVSSNRCKDAWDGRSWDSHEPRKSMEYWIKMEYRRAFKWDWELVWQVRMTRWMCS